MFNFLNIAVSNIKHLFKLLNNTCKVHIVNQVVYNSYTAFFTVYTVHAVQNSMQIAYLY